MITSQAIRLLTHQRARSSPAAIHERAVDGSNVRMTTHRARAGHAVPPRHRQPGHAHVEMVDVLVEVIMVDAEPTV
jgi:hypothetical protein